MLTSDMQAIICGFTAGAVATIGPDGAPKVSIKATFVVLDDATIAYGDLRSPGTRANLLADPRVEVCFTDVLERKAVRVTGTATILKKDEAPEIDAVFAAGWGDFRNSMSAYVKIDVTAAELILSPAYDRGETAEALRWANLAKLPGLHAPYPPAAYPTRTNELGQIVGAPLPEDWTPPPAPSREALEGRYCLVEPLDAAKHGADLFQALERDETGEGWTYLFHSAFESEAAFSSFLAQIAEKDYPLQFAYIDKATGKAVGFGSYLRIAPLLGSIEVGGLRFSPLMQRTPVSTEAMHLMMAHAFDLGYRRYEWKCDNLNLPSKRAAERLGFVYEGVFRKAVHNKGRNRDTAWFAIVDDDWPTVRAAHEAWLDPANFDLAGQQKRSLRDIMTGDA